MWILKKTLAKLGVITGKDAERFVENMKNVKPISLEERERMQANYKAIIKKAKF